MHFPLEYLMIKDELKIKPRTGENRRKEREENNRLIRIGKWRRENELRRGILIKFKVKKNAMKFFWGFVFEK